MSKDELQLILEEGKGYRIEFKESKAGLPPIKFEFDNFFTVTFERLKIKEPVVIPETFSKKFDEMLHYEGVNEGVKARLK